MNNKLKKHNTFCQHPCIQFNHIKRR